MKKYNNKSTLIFIAVTFILGMCTSCSSNTSEKNTSNPAEILVKVAKPEMRFHQQVKEYTGTIRPWREANLGTSIPGRVEQLYFSEGSFVKKGSLIARMSAEPAIMAKVELDSWENDYSRVKRLKERGSISRQDFDHVEAQYKAAKAKYELMQKNTQIRAPFDGHIMEILVREGETFFFMPALQPGVSFSPGVVRFMQLQPVKAEINIPEKDLPLLKEAREIVVRADALPDAVFQGKLHRTAAMVSPDSRTIAAEIHVDNLPGELMVGMFVKITAKLSGKEMLFIPNHALMKEIDQEYFVWVVGPRDKAVKKKVTRLTMAAGDVAVSGLEISDRIITAGFSSLEEGCMVKYQ